MIQLVIAWTCVGVFVATAIITLLALVGAIKLAEKKYLDRLFKVLVLEIVGVCIGIFTGKIELPKTVEKRVSESAEAKGEEAGRKKFAEAIRPRLDALTGALNEKQRIINGLNLGGLDLSQADKEALKRPVDTDVMSAALARRGAVAPR